MDYTCNPCKLPILLNRVQNNEYGHKCHNHRPTHSTVRKRHGAQTPTQPQLRIEVEQSTRSTQAWCLQLLWPRFEKSGAILDLGCQSVRPSVRHNFVSAQYLDNKAIEFTKFCIVHWYWQDLGWDCFLVIFRTFVPELWPLKVYDKISFPLNILRTN